MSVIQLALQDAIDIGTEGPEQLWRIGAGVAATFAQVYLRSPKFNPHIHTSAGTGFPYKYP